MSNLNAHLVIEKLKLKPHPEGGHYRQTFKDTATVLLNDNSGRTRSALTDIYFMLSQGEKSRVHKVNQAEIWHFYAGAPLFLYDLSEDLETLDIIELGKGLNFKYAVKPNHWQGAISTGEYSLVGCTVAPGFEFEDFSFLSDCGELAGKVTEKYPNLAFLI